MNTLVAGAGVPNMIFGIVDLATTVIAAGVPKVTFYARPRHHHHHRRHNAMSEATSSKFKFNRSYYGWRQTGGVWRLIRSSRVVAVVTPDPRFPSMFQIKFPDGSISDIVNLTRAKDAALSLADAVLDGRIRGFQAPGIARSAEATRLQADSANAPRKPAGANPTRHRDGIASQHAAEPDQLDEWDAKCATAGRTTTIPPAARNRAPSSRTSQKTARQDVDASVPVGGRDV
jgi:hypothetical protein